MNKNSPLFVKILSILFQMILFVGNFMGLLYLFEGNIAFSIAGSAVLSILYFFLIQILVDNKEIMYRNKFRHSSSYLWLFYLGLGLISMFLLTHFINIEYNAKADIQNSAYDKIEVVKKALKTYKERANKDIEDYEYEFKTLVTDYKINQNLNSLTKLTSSPYNMDRQAFANPDYIDIDRMASAHLAPLQEKIEININTIDSVFQKDNSRYSNIFNNWKRLELIQTYSNLNDYVEKSTTTINNMLQELPFDKSTVEFNFDKDKLPLNSPRKLNKQFKPNYSLPIIIVLIFHFFLLIPFIAQPRRVYVDEEDPNSKERKAELKDGEPIRRSGSIEL